MNDDEGMIDHAFECLMSESESSRGSPLKRQTLSAEA